MYCQKCGNTLAPGARFCNACGTPVTMTAAAAPVSMERPTLVTAIAVLHFVGGPLMLLGALGMFATMGSGSQSDRVVALVLAVMLLLLGLLSLATGFGLWQMREWGRVLQIVLASIGLLGVPLGTIISILLLIYFMRPHVKLLFSGRRIDQLTPDEVAVLRASAGGAGSGAAGVVIALVAVVLVVGFIGILAAIAVPNLLTAMQRSRQLRSIADMRQMAVSVETYRAEHENAPPASIPARKDAWTHDFRYVTDGKNYWIVCAGRDGKFEEDDASHYTRGTTTNFDDDVVLENGDWLRYPERSGAR